MVAVAFCAQRFVLLGLNETSQTRYAEKKRERKRFSSIFFESNLNSGLIIFSRAGAMRAFIALFQTLFA